MSAMNPTPPDYDQKGDQEGRPMSTTQPYPIPAGLHNGKTIFCANGPRDHGRPFDQFRYRVKWPHQHRAWLAEKLGTDTADPKLDAKAIRAALHGELVVYIDKADQLADFGSPKGRRRKWAS
jgi:hypothetical protein